MATAIYTSAVAITELLVGLSVALTMAVARPGALYGTNTSQLSITAVVCQKDSPGLLLEDLVAVGEPPPGGRVEQAEDVIDGPAAATAGRASRFRQAGLAARSL
jgi:hypothetical protein